MIGKKPEKPLSQYQITFTRHTIHPLDIDNLVASFKPVLDSLVRAGVIEDDKWCTTENLKYRQEKAGSRAKQRVTVEVESIVDAGRHGQ